MVHAQLSNTALTSINFNIVTCLLLLRVRINTTGQFGVKRYLSYNGYKSSTKSSSSSSSSSILLSVKAEKKLLERLQLIY